MGSSSPFPGMDPYLEGYWPDVHAKLATFSAVALNARLPDDLVASIEERTQIISRDDRPNWRRPDVGVVEEGQEQPRSGTGGGTVVAQPVRVEAPVVARLMDVEPMTERWVRIVEAGTERLVTAIEFLSPSNKKSPGLRDFRRKRNQLLEQGANLVEVDLTRAGDWQRLMGPISVDDHPERLDTPYRVAIRLPHEPDRVYLTPIRLQDRLPEIAIPLRPGDPRVTLDLQALLDDAYRTGRYGRRIDYSRPPEPPLAPDEAARAANLLADKGPPA